MALAVFISIALFAGTARTKKDSEANVYPLGWVDLIQLENGQQLGCVVEPRPEEERVIAHCAPLRPPVESSPHRRVPDDSI